MQHGSLWNRPDTTITNYYRLCRVFNRQAARSRVNCRAFANLLHLACRQNGVPVLPRIESFQMPIPARIAVTLLEMLAPQAMAGRGSRVRARPRVAGKWLSSMRFEDLPKRQRSQGLCSVFKSRAVSILVAVSCQAVDAWQRCSARRTRFETRSVPASLKAGPSSESVAPVQRRPLR